MLRTRGTLQICLVVCLPAGCPRPGSTRLDRSSESKLICDRDASRTGGVPLPSRAQCLLPPWTPGGSQLAGQLAGLAHQTCGDRGHLVERAGARIPTHEQLAALVQRNEKAFADGSVASYSGGGGPCCGGQGEAGKRLCLRFDLHLCKVTLEAFTEKLLAMWDADPALADAAVSLELNLIGRTESRCETGSCQPIPYDGTLVEQGYRCDGPRNPVGGKNLSWGTCAYDGDCAQAGCGNQCVPWTESIVGTCEGYLWSKPVFCGCVQGKCSWFSH